MTKWFLGQDRPPFTKMIDEIETITFNGYTLLIDEENWSASIINSIKEDDEMSMLSEKRQEIQAKLDALLSERNARIEARIAAYRRQLEAEPICAEAIEIKNVLKAIDEVIAYDAAYVAPVAQPVAETIATPVAPTIKEVVVETIAQPAPAVEAMPAGQVITPAQPDCRPGMASIDIPERG